MSTLSDTAIAANRANARNSTGPRTPRGKAIAAANALRHGIFAKDLLLTGESADELLELKAAMIGRLDPRDSLELELVERVVAACWKLRRLQRFERWLYQQQAEQFSQKGYEVREANGLGHREPIPAEVAWQSGGAAFQEQLDRIENHQHRLENALHRSLRQLERLRKQEIEPSPGRFAEDSLAAERGQHEKRRNEAANAQRTAEAAQLVDARAKRERLRIEREFEFAEELYDGVPGSKPRQQLAAYLFPEEKRRNEAAKSEPACDPGAASPMNDVQGSNEVAG